MKVRFLQTFFTFALILAVSMAYAQPANDDCGGAIAVELGADEASCVKVDGNTTGGTGSLNPLSVCSNSWFGDDVWFTLEAPATFEQEIITVKTEFGGQGGDVLAVGMAIYPSCNPDERPIACFSSNDPEQNELLVYTRNMTPGATHYIRVWSGGSPTDDSGSFRICAYYEQGQIDNIFWEETFDGGLGEWTSVSLNGTPDTAAWVHTIDPSRGAFGNYTITSPTSRNGAALYDADWFVSGGDDTAPIAGPPYPNWEAELISPIIDCTDSPPLSLKFWQTYRALNGQTFFQWSIDGGMTWSDRIEINADVEANDQTPVPSIRRYFLPDLQDQDSVRIKFVFDADFYAWFVDDVRLIETERNNLRVQNNWYAIPPNVQTPARMVEPFRFMADIYNAGSATQTGVNLNVTITEASGTVAPFSTDLAYGAITADSLAENQLFELTYTPQQDLITDYTVTYTLSSDSTDFDPVDNSISYTFSATNDVFAKETGATRNLRPADGLWADNAPHSWSIGNYYYVPTATASNGEPIVARNAIFGITNPQDHGGKDLIIWLYKWTDVNGDEIAQRGVADGELETIGFNTYTITGSEAAPFLLNIPLLDFNDPDPEPGPAPLEGGNAYLLVMQYTTPDDDDNLLVEASEAHNYSATVFASQQTDTGSGLMADPRYSHVLGIGSEEYYRLVPSADIAETNFGHDIVPQAHLIISPGSEPVNTTELSPENITNIFPVPSNNVLNVDIELVNPSDKLSLKVFDMSGRIVDYREMSNVQQDRVIFDVNNYGVGTYLLQIITDEGARTRKFIVQR
ncbi:MAG: T9SS type A sorting domain-containing protein [Bacteroidota bacterium]